MNKQEIVLSDADIQSIINGRKVTKRVNDEPVVIRQSYIEDLAAPIVIDRYNVKDEMLEKQLRDIRAIAQSPFMEGYR
ncbi:hypothetical protein AACA76_03860 [Enterococcus faecalis]|uniref:hypothetical protein n=1 Tax=Enterococcus faecalis TaxID=1351 RepID=UPI00317B9B15